MAHINFFYCEKGLTKTKEGGALKTVPFRTFFNNVKKTCGKGLGFLELLTDLNFDVSLSEYK